METLPELVEELFDDVIYTCMAYNPSGTLLACGSFTGPVIIIDYRTHCPVRILSYHTTRVSCVAFTHDGRLLLAASESGQVVAWRLPEVELHSSYQLPQTVTSINTFGIGKLAVFNYYNEAAVRGRP